MSARNPDFATLSEAAYEAADRALVHVRFCALCGDVSLCSWGKSLMGNYKGLKNKALKALRRGSKKVSTTVASDNDSITRVGRKK